MPKEIFDGRYVLYEDGELYSVIHGIFLHGGYVSRDKHYRTYCIYIDGESKNFYAHRLVAENFIPNPCNYPQLNHIDGNAKNNSVENLEWCTAKHNMQHAYRTGLIQRMREGKPCMLCGRITISKTGYCKSCLKIIKSLNNKVKSIKRRKSEVCAVDTESLTDKQRQYVTARMSGQSIGEIATACGVTRQCVSLAIRRVIQRAERV